MVDEFSSFARLPKAEIKLDDFTKLVNDCYLLYSNAHVNIKFKIINNHDKIPCNFDRSQLSLVLNNITKNAIEALFQVKNAFITFEVIKDDKFVSLKIIDNGIGIDKNIINKLFEPYFTTKEKGTGLGLSICKKIIEDHGGKISIIKNTTAGSTVTLSVLI